MVRDFSDSPHSRCGAIIIIIDFFTEISVAVDAAMMVDIEEMDWQPASLSESLIASKNECPSANIAGNDDRAVIVPDTNIFLSSLICIKDIIAKGECSC